MLNHPRGELLVVEGESRGTVLRMDGRGSYSVGRSKRSDLPLRDSRASRRHCTVECDGRCFWLVDPGSVNGTFVNGKRVRRYLLYAGDRIRVGNSFMVFREVAGEH